ncbi:hypothetical protein HZI73_17180 [Vallitalea pronyensis]|uniref:S-layer homology domain-containing protein n=1 Tax=Vallitalea pronyensis TaxID=1348613 RepID=A0A8J8MM39_9FIRM|nr:hypothetical protein [Vallitalea pronyensis]QUI23917.1 hypothetical protein HZI73_17180 [Vallitalea pronyensis]
MKKKKRSILAFVLAANVLLSCAPSYAISHEQMREAPIYNLADRGILKGEGSQIDGSKTITRYRSVVMLLRLLNLEEDMANYDFVGKDTFDDANGHNMYIQRLMGYIKAHPELHIAWSTDDTFQPYKEITSTEYVAMLLQVLNYHDKVDYTQDTVKLKAEQVGLFYYENDVFNVYELARLTYKVLQIIPKGTVSSLGEQLGVPVVNKKIDIESVESIDATLQKITLKSYRPKAFLETSYFKLTDSQKNTFALTSVYQNPAYCELSTEPLKTNEVYTLTYGEDTYTFVAKPADTEQPRLILAKPLSNNKMQIQFSEDIKPYKILDSYIEVIKLDGMTNVPDDYKVDITAMNLVMNEDGSTDWSTYIIHTTRQEPGEYRIHVPHIKDLTNKPIDTEHSKAPYSIIQ